MPADSSYHPFSDDSPRTNPWQHDALGYKPFADRLATALVNIDAPTGYVLGLHGAWGSGKSTALNFTEAFMQKRREEGEEAYTTTELIRFEPWIVSGYQDLAAAFFKQLSDRIADGAAKKHARKSRFGKALKLGINPAFDAAATLGAALDHSGGLVSKSVASAGKKGLGETVDRWLAEPSLQKTYDQLVDRLRVAGGRYVVMIDDIDRLSADEIRSIMHMVKTVGRLPNVIYVLAYDREIVWAALRDDADADIDTIGRRPQFAEKIIQHEVELPVPSRHSLLTMFDREASFLPSPPPDSMRWYDLAHAGLYRWIKHPRDVARFANALRFVWPALADEIDAQDLICMEGLRLFDRPVYEWIREHRDLLLREGRAAIFAEQRQGSVAEAFKAALPEQTRDDIIAIMCALFPNSEKFFRGDKQAVRGESWFKVANRRGIATKAAFSAYFSLAPSPTAIPKSLIDFAMSHLSDEKAQVECIIEATAREDEWGNSLVGEYFQDLQYRFYEGSALPTQALFNALISTEAAIDTIEWKGDIFSPISNLYGLLSALLKQIGRDRAAATLTASFAKGVPLTTKCSLLIYQARQLGLIPGGGNSREPAISADRFRRLADDLLPEIERQVGAGELADAKAYYDILQMWAFLGHGAKARAWSAELAASSPRHLAKLSLGLLGYSRSQGGRSYSLYDRPDSDIYDVEALRNAADSFVNATDITDDERQRIAALKLGLEGISDREASDAEDKDTEE